MNDGPRRILPIKNPTTIISLPGIDGLISDTVRIIEHEIIRFHHKIGKGQALNLEDARLLQGYTRNLVELSKELRERAKKDSEDISSMPDEKLAELMVTVLSSKLTHEQILELVAKILTKGPDLEPKPQGE